MKVNSPPKQQSTYWLRSRVLIGFGRNCSLLGAEGLLRMFWELDVRRVELLRNQLNRRSAVSSLFVRCHGIAELPSVPGSSVFQLVSCVTETIGTNCSRSPSMFPGHCLSEKTRRFRNREKATFGRANETRSVCFGRVLVKLLFTGVEPKSGLGGLELESLRIVTGEILTASSSEEVDSLSSSSALLSCVTKWIGCGATLGRVYEETD